MSSAAGTLATRPFAGIDDAYADWIRTHDSIDADDRPAMLRAIAAMAAPPVIALLLAPGFATAGRLQDTLVSLRMQVYPHWELLVAGPPPAALARVLGGDARVRRIGGGPYQDRAAAANALLAQSGADFVVLLDEGDILAANALLELADALARHPDGALIYADEDLIDAAGQRCAPLLKPGWDPDLLLACDYIGAPALYRADSVRAAGGWRSGFGSADGYDLALRATARMLPDRIHHVPAVLCHRPAERVGKLRDLMFGPDAEAGRAAVRDLLGARAQVQASPLLPSCNRIVWPVPEPAPRVSIIMPTRDRPWLLGPAAWGVLLRTEYENFELLIIDNDSREEATMATFRDLAKHPKVRIIAHPGDFNFSAMCNRAVAEARGDVVVLLNNDIDVIGANWLGELVSHAMRPEIGAVGCRLLYADGTLQHGGVVLGPGPCATHYLRLSERSDPGYAGLLAVTRSYSVVTGACMALRRAVFLEVGGFDAEHLAVSFNDIDFCLRLGEYGYRVVCTPFAELFHLESQSRGVPDSPEKRARETREVNHLWRTWQHCFDRDPYHNPNLACAWNEPLHLCPPRQERPWRRQASGVSA